MNHDDDDLNETEHTHDDEFEGVYIVDDDTAELLATAIGILQMCSGIQLGEDHRENLLIIADELQARFAIEKDSITVEERIVTDPETGEEEILYRPQGGVMGDHEDEDDPEEAEGPAVEPEEPQSG
jgi:hypothetical protein